MKIPNRALCLCRDFRIRSPRRLPLGILFGLAVGFVLQAAAPICARASARIGRGADAPFYIGAGGGWGSVLDHDAVGFAAFELRPGWRWAGFGSWAGAFYGSPQVYLGAGVLREVVVGRGWALNGSFGGGFYHSGGGLPLGHTLEFRSAIEIGRTLIGSSRLTAAFGHLSNGGFGDRNPGTELVWVLILIPL